MSETSDNHAKAPWSAGIVAEWRSLDPQLRIIHVNENGVSIGERTKPGAPCIHAGDGRTLQEAYSCDAA